jgi:hypothetical protein
MKLFGSILCLLALFVACSDDPAKPEGVTNAVYGIVRDAQTKNPIAGAEVQIDVSEIESHIYIDTTDAGGEYVIENVTEGSLSMGVKATGYITLTGVNQPHDGNITMRNFDLTPDTTLNP